MVTDEAAIFVGASTSADQYLLLKYANSHGLIAGATGTGKTRTLQSIVEGFSAFGVPVFITDVKGDLSGVSQPGGDDPKALERATQLGIDGYAGRPFSTTFWDLFGEKGHPIRTRVSEFGPVLMARLLQLNDTQEGVLNIVFRLADQQGLLLLDFKDLQAWLQWVAENAGTLTAEFGSVSKQSVGAIQRQLLTLRQQGGEEFFGEPALVLTDMIRCDLAGYGTINILAADRLMQSPRLYATFLLWLLSELFESLPEVGDLDKPKFVFFFDEAHLLFDDAPKALLSRIEQVVRLIGSKGVGIYFVTQNPLGVPETVQELLGNRVQHALRAFTPREQRAVKVAAEMFRPNKAFSASQAITELGIGEALLSFLDSKGLPFPVERCFIAPPRGRIGPATPEERAVVMAASPLAAKYDKPVDRASAYEVLTGRLSPDAQPTPSALPPSSLASRSGPWGGRLDAPSEFQTQKQAPPRGMPRLAPAPKEPAGRQHDSSGVTVAKAASRNMRTIAAREAAKVVFGRSRATSVGASIGGAILRGVLGSIFRR